MKNSKLIFAFVSLFLLAFQQLLFGQSYDHFIALGDSAYEAKNFQLSGEYYDEAFSIEINNRDAYKASCSWSLAANLKKAINYLNLSLKSELNPSWGHIHTDPDLAYLRKSEEYRLLEEKYHKHENTVLHFPDVLKLIMNDGKWQTIFDNKTIVIPDRNASKEIFASLGFEDSIFRMPEKRVYFKNCIFIHDYVEGIVEVFNIDSWVLKSLTINNYNEDLSKLAFFEIKNCSFDALMLWNDPDLIIIESSNIRYFNYFTDSYSRLRLTSSILEQISLFGKNLQSLLLEDNTFNYSQKSMDHRDDEDGFQNVNINAKIEFVYISNNSFNGLDSLDSFGSISVNCDDLSFRGNTVGQPFNFNSTVVNNQLNIVDNKFSKVDFSSAVFPELNSYIPYEQFGSSNISIFEEGSSGVNPSKVVSNNLDEGFDDKETFEKLIYQYQRLYNNYRLRGEIESANQSYIAIKQLHIEKYKNIQANNPSMKNYFKLKIGQLLGFYVEHGTNPAKAIVISVYILFAFAVFYFFFPSEWDTTSKARLISDFKDFRQKNNKGYIKPFFIMLGGFSLSLLNAFTLSLNSFVTLGFGTIPTKGLARYVCILQGFIGWFLLSIFTVALINQVLA